MGAIKKQAEEKQFQMMVIDGKKKTNDEGRLTRLEVLGALVAVPIGWLCFVIFGCLR